ncbi:hypothetical protein [Nitrosovibrio sp. Nv17]|uniref:hypothetical protein n=1 Tax=Nitrosovibrio sp. Nv17 TaxID=1855339 RepID=UPI0009091AF3|nr:hypothetical protein [Nitrosovibrio sp. Nv17]SFW21496.1 hypothetical protein SAMN05216414_10666 [Nitrosovibrio sp. Nv17]
MSNVNIKRAIENIRANTIVYAPIVDMIVNGIQAIEETSRKDGNVQIRARRSSQVELDGSLPEVVGFEIEYNGIGFTDAGPAGLIPVDGQYPLCIEVLS